MVDEIAKFAPRRSQMSERMEQTLAQMDHALNGPARPSMPAASPFMVEDAEAEIRRNVQRHYDQLAKIEVLTTDSAHWRQQAQVFKAESERLEARCHDQEMLIGELKDTITTLRTQFESGAEIWLKSYQVLNQTPHVKVVTPQQLEKKSDEPASHKS
jgi:hypothetical protein